MGVLGVTASLVGSLQAMEALRLLLHRPPAYADRFVYFDGDSGLIHAMALSP
jgi:molybdopterin/thiamine biosynthesis adenylyltransferase